MIICVQKVGERRSRVLRRPRDVYRVWSENGSVETITAGELDKRLRARRFPGGHWAMVAAANDAFDPGYLDTAIEWPSGRRIDVLQI